LVSFSQSLDKKDPAAVFAGLFLFARIMPDDKNSINREAILEEDLRDIRKVLGGEPETFKRLVERHQNRVSSLMRRFTRDHELHEELVQDVFVEAYFSLSSYRAKAPFSHWLSRIATHVGYRFWKKKYREERIQTVPLLEKDHPLLHPSCDMNSAKAADLLYNLLELLPSRDRLVITLRFVEDRSVEETALMTGWSEVMVKVQTWRAKGKLKKILDKKGVKIQG
jgi:RNA polymerase sigma-70 factor (ECF subfamily)